MSAADSTAATAATPVRTPAKASFAWDDPLLLDEQLSEDERIVLLEWCRSGG